MPLSRRSTLLGPTLLGLVGAGLPFGVAAADEAGLAPIDAVRTYETGTGGHVGFWAQNVATGATISWRAGQRFAMCSTFKMSVGALVLRRVDRGQDRLDAPIRLTAADVPDWYAPVAKANLARGGMSVEEMCQAAVEKSDNSCANLLLARVGGPVAVTAFWREIGDPISRLDHNEPSVNRVPPGGEQDTTTPEAMAGNIRRFVLGDVLSPPSRTLLTRWLIRCTTGLDRLRGGLPPGWIAGDKTGNNAADAAGDVMVAWPADGGAPIVACAYTRGGTPDIPTLKGMFTAIGQEVAARLA